MMIKLIILLSLCGSLIAGNIKGHVNILYEKSNAGAVVYIEKIPGKTFTPPGAHAQINQKNFMFIPKVLPVLQGTIVDFLNSDNVLHNVFSPDAPDGEFNLGTWPRGFVRSDTFKTAGVATILCNVHPEMEAYVLALQNPYFAVTDSVGAYRIKEVPAGKYKLSAWYFSADKQTRVVSVPAKNTLNIDFVFK